MSDASEFFDMVSQLADNLREEVEKMPTEFAQEYKRRLLDNIRKNKYQIKLAPSTIRKKGSSVPMIDTGELIQAIVLDGSKVFLKDGTHKSGLSYNELGNILEYGRLDGHIVGNWVWGRTYNEFLTEYVNPRFDALFKKYGL